MNNKLEILKRLTYRAGYRGTKEMDILLSSFVDKYIKRLMKSLFELEKFLNLEDDVIALYNNNVVDKQINENKISKIFKSFKL